jgi:hypothetical protein
VYIPRLLPLLLHIFTPFLNFFARSEAYTSSLTFELEYGFQMCNDNI